MPRFRHYLYEWLGVDKVELAVMAELLLRGAQTEGELRGRAARMEPIADVSALRPVLVALKQKRLVIALTPEGRGHMVTHVLYEPRELEKVRAEAASGVVAHDSAESSDSSHEPEIATKVAHLRRCSPRRTIATACRKSLQRRQTTRATSRRSPNSDKNSTRFARS